MSDKDWIEQFPGLGSIEERTRARLIERSRVVSVPKGTVIFGPGKAPESMLLLIEGTVRVQEISEGGREIVLYRVSRGESCVLTTACLLADENYLAEGIAETDIAAVAIPRQTFEDLIAGSSGFRRFVFSAYSKTLTELFMIIQEIAFSRIDIRLAQRLCGRSNADSEVFLTHQQLANELGTAREVISRQLNEFLRRNWIHTARGKIRLTNKAALDRLAMER